MLNKMTVRSRILLGFSFVIALFLAAAGSGIERSMATGATSDAIVYGALKIEPLIAELDEIIAVNLTQTIAAARTNEADYEAYLIASNQKGSQRASEIYEILGHLLVDEESKRRFDALMVKRKAYLDVRTQVFTLKAEQGVEAARSFVESSFLPVSTDYLSASHALADYQRQTFKQLNEQIHAKNATSIRLTLALSLFACVASVAAALLVARSVVRQLGGEPGAAARIAGRIADGDLGVEVRVAPGDTHSVLYAIAMMRARLADIVTQVRQGTTLIDLSSAEVAQGAMELSSRTEQQASALEEAAASMEELTSAIRQNSEHTQHARQLAVMAEDLARQGAQSVDAVVTTMDTIKDSSAQIADIISVIEGIAFQTNILALNAAVEAARAGEQGRGFAVVASEVRNLAHRSAAAAKDIKLLIDTAVSNVARGNASVTEAGAKIASVLEGFRSVGVVISEIATASDEQRAGVEQINTAVVELDHVTQRNAALVEESAAAAQSLREQAAHLAQLVAVFRTAEPAQASPAPGTRALPRHARSAVPDGRKQSRVAYRSTAC